MVAPHDGFPKFEWELSKLTVVTGLIVDGLSPSVLHL